MKPVLIVVGTRPEAIKLLPVYLELLKNEVEVELLHTGQHKTLADDVFALFGCQPDRKLDVMRPKQSLSSLTSMLITKLENEIRRSNPSIVIVQGDTTSAMTGALVAFYNNVKVAHVEAGLRSNDKMQPFPEEINRRVISQIADIHFAPTVLAYQNLRDEGITEAQVTGNTVVDAVRIMAKNIKKNLSSYDVKFKDQILASEGFAIITCHRRENHGKNLVRILEAIRSLAEDHKGMNFLFPYHPNPNVRSAVIESFADHQNVTTSPPLPYDELIYLMGRARLLVSDSGGLQEEAASFGLPVVILREQTERPEIIDCGLGILAGSDQKRIYNAFRKQLHVKNEIKNPFGDGYAAVKIADAIKATIRKD